MSPDKPLIIDPDEILKKYNSRSKISHYLDLLKRENKKINLVSRETNEPDLIRLAAESLAPFEIINQQKFENYLDIGSGGGFPAFPILLSFEIQNSVLIERTKKKAAALNRFSQDLKLNCKVLDQNLDDCELNEKFDLITLRLVRLSKPLLTQIENLLVKDGLFIYFSHFDEMLKKPDLKYSTYAYATGHDSPLKSFAIFKN